MTYTRIKLSMEDKFYKEIKKMERSLARREEYISSDTPVCKVNWDHFEDMPEDITVQDMYDYLELHEDVFGEVKI